MRFRSLLLWVLFILFFLQNYSFAYNYLVVQDPRRSWYSYDGTIEEAVVSVHPSGVFMEIGLYLTFSARGTSFGSSDTLEIQFYFDLPEQAIVHDLWLWVGDDIMRAVIMDKWKASSIYENIVKRRRDPAILFKDYENQYQLRIYPMPGNQQRKIKLTYLVPAQWFSNSVSIPLPVNMLTVSYSPLDYLKILFWPDQEWLNPEIVEAPEQSFTANEDSLSNTYYSLRLPFGYSVSSLNLSVDSPLKDGIYLNCRAGDEENYYQLVLIPAQVMDISSQRKFTLLFDYEINNSSLSTQEIISTVRHLLHQQLVPTDSFNLFFSGLPVKSAGDNWFSGDSSSIEAAFLNVGGEPFSNYSNLPALFSSSIQFIKSHGGAGSILLVAASDQLGDYQAANPFIKDLLDLMNPVIPVHVADIQDQNYSYYYIGSRYFYGNEYFYENITKQTGGNYTRLSWETSFSSIFSKALNGLSGSVTSLDLYTTMQNGFCYGRFNLWPLNKPVYLDQPLVQLGKYIGDFPFEIKTSGMYKSEPFTSNVQVSQDQASAGDSLVIETWTGSYILYLESQEQSNELVNEIIDYSIKERILSLYTAFLALEPSDTTKPCLDCYDESEMTNVENNSAVVVRADTLLRAYPNPFNSTVSIKVRLARAYKSKEVSFKIYDIMGKVVKEFEVPAYSVANDLTIEWNGLNGQGGMVASGTYFFVMTTPVKRTSIKLLYLK